MNGLQSNYPLTSLSRQKIHIICRFIPCQAIICTWSDNRQFSKTSKNQRPTRVNFILPTSQQIWTLQTGSTRCSREQPVMQRPRYRKVSIRSAHISIPVGVRKFTYASRNGLLISYVNLRTKVLSYPETSFLCLYLHLQQ